MWRRIGSCPERLWGGGNLVLVQDWRKSPSCAYPTATVLVPWNWVWLTAPACWLLSQRYLMCTFLPPAKPCAFPGPYNDLAGQICPLGHQLPIPALGHWQSCTGNGCQTVLRIEKFFCSLLGQTQNLLKYFMESQRELTPEKPGGYGTCLGCGRPKFKSLFYLIWSRDVTLTIKLFWWVASV